LYVAERHRRIGRAANHGRTLDRAVVRGAAHAFFSKGDLTVMIGIFKTGKGDADYVKRLAVEQYKRLPAWS
jgi:hypothetical protein